MPNFVVELLLRGISSPLAYSIHFPWWEIMKYAVNSHHGALDEAQLIEMET